MQTNRNTYRWTDRMIDRYLGKTTDRQSIRQTDRQTNWRTDTYRQTGRHTQNKETHKIKKIEPPTRRQLNKLMTRRRISKRKNKPTDRNWLPERHQPRSDQKKKRPSKPGLLKKSFISVSPLMDLFAIKVKWWSNYVHVITVEKVVMKIG